MEDGIISRTPDRFRVRTVEPRVARLPDGHVQMMGDIALFPERCPRCGGSPAKTEVKLRLTKGRLFKVNDGTAPAGTEVNLRSIRASLFKNSNRTIKIPFCQRCGWTLKATQYIPAILGGVFIVFVIPLLQHSHRKLFPSFSTGIAVGMTASLVDAAFRHLPRLFVKPGVQIVAITKDSAELAFDDPMYAEQFVLLNR
jgi:ribosomal protein S27AE